MSSRLRVAVTGASGFIGAHVVAALNAAGHSPIGFARSEHRMRDAFEVVGAAFEIVGANEVALMAGDVTDVAAVRALLSDCDAVVHTAGRVTTKGTDDDLMMSVNAGGTAVVLREAIAAGLDPIIHISSVAALQPPASAGALSAVSPITSSSAAYARSKARAERTARTAQAQGHPVVIFYPGGVYGPNDPGTSDMIDGNVMMIEKGVFVLPSGGGCNWVDVRDLADAIAESVTPGMGPRRFMAGGHRVEWGEWAETISRHAGTKIRAITVPSGVLQQVGSGLDLLRRRTRLQPPLSREAVESMAWTYATDDSAIETELGVRWRPFDESARDFVQWLAQDGRIG